MSKFWTEHNMLIRKNRREYDKQKNGITEYSILPKVDIVARYQWFMRPDVPKLLWRTKAFNTLLKYLGLSQTILF